MAHKRIDTGVAKNLFSFADGVEAAPNLRWLFSSGTPGMLKDGSLPEGIEAQTIQCWKNCVEILEAAGMGLEDIVKATTTIKHAEHIPAYGVARDKIFTLAKKPAAHLLVASLVRPEILVEVEIVAAKAV